jgi:hypothetical protein
MYDGGAFELKIVTKHVFKKGSMFHVSYKVKGDDSSGAVVFLEIMGKEKRIRNTYTDASNGEVCNGGVIDVCQVANDIKAHLDGIKSWLLN